MSNEVVLFTEVHPDPSAKVKEVAGFMNCGEPTVYEMVHRGELQAYRIGRAIRITSASVDEYMRSNLVRVAS